MENNEQLSPENRPKAPKCKDHLPTIHGFRCELLVLGSVYKQIPGFTVDGWEEACGAVMNWILSWVSMKFYLCLFISVVLE